MRGRPIGQGVQGVWSAGVLHVIMTDQGAARVPAVTWLQPIAQ